MSTEQRAAILDDESLETAWEYIARLSGPLAQAVFGRSLPIDTLCIFAQSEEEHDFVLGAIKALGPISRFTHESTTYVDVNMEVGGQVIKFLGVRKPDPTRPQVGYADYPIPDYQALLANIADYPDAEQIMSGRGQSLVELRHPDFDILEYAFDSREH